MDCDAFTRRPGGPCAGPCFPATDMFTTAKLKLPDFIKEKHRKKRPVGAPVTFGDARKLYVADLDIHVLDRSLDDNRGPTR